MCADEFAYWLKGYFELSDSNTLTEQQVKIIKEHLTLVFTKVTKQQLGDLSASHRRIC